MDWNELISKSSKLKKTSPKKSPEKKFKFKEIEERRSKIQGDSSSSKSKSLSKSKSPKSMSPNKTLYKKSSPQKSINIGSFFDKINYLESKKDDSMDIVQDEWDDEWNEPIYKKIKADAKYEDRPRTSTTKKLSGDNLKNFETLFKPRINNSQKADTLEIKKRKYENISIQETPQTIKVVFEKTSPLSKKMKKLSPKITPIKRIMQSPIIRSNKPIKIKHYEPKYGQVQSKILSPIFKMSPMKMGTIKPIKFPSPTRKSSPPRKNSKSKSSPRKSSSPTQYFTPPSFLQEEISCYDSKCKNCKLKVSDLKEICKRKEINIPKKIKKDELCKLCITEEDIDDINSEQREMTQSYKSKLRKRN